ncbi:MAG: hypothetical protein AVDCRST_MAG79-1918 [uncultured Thermoleophilia bacterium]|uniref:Secreted protein n=1 Tax=uncultured Thermoleophilia bacterium TaxID=1497501 RepID=A0A6J4U9F9_9ACTN|nr:MAG: hypothetical protein AVDCRST_MAG79-1918 [uncultured Thermoleophilia bacterium]
MSRMLLATTVLAAGALAVGAGTASAERPDRVRVAGSCNGPSTAKLKLSEEDGRIEVEYEVDQNRNGVRWNVVLRRRGVVVARGTRRTTAPSGSFEFRRLLADRPGTDTVTATATRRGETCRATARL